MTIQQTLKIIDVITIDNNALTRGPNGGSMLQVAPQVTSYRRNGDTSFAILHVTGVLLL